MRHTLKKLPLLLVMIATLGIFARGNAQPMQVGPSEQYKVLICGIGGIILWGIEANSNSVLSSNFGVLDYSGSMSGYRWNEKLFSALWYQGIKLDAETIDLSYLSLKYQFGDSGFSSYVDVIVGCGRLVRDRVLDAMDADSDFASMSMVVNNNLSIFAKYEIIEAKKAAEHKKQQNLIGGAEYVL